MADEIKPELLVLVEDSLAALKMIVTWPKTFLEFGELIGPGTFNRLRSESPFAEQWAAISGVDIDDIEKWAPVLFENGLILDTGEVSMTAYGYCANRGMAILDSVKT